MVGGGKKLQIDIVVVLQSQHETPVVYRRQGFKLLLALVSRILLQIVKYRISQHDDIVDYQSLDIVSSYFLAQCLEIYSVKTVWWQAWIVYH